MTKNSASEPKPIKGINVYILLFFVLVVAAIFSHILPAGQFERQLVDGRNIVVPGTYKIIESAPISPFGVFTAVHDGMVSASAVMFYVIFIGGMIAVINATGAINASLGTVTKNLADRPLLFIAATMFVFSLGGSFIGMSEESLMYIPIVIPIALALGFDVIVGTAIVLFGMGIGFTTAIANPFTVGIAQSIAGLPMFSGIGVRIFLYCIMYVTAVGFVYSYAKKVKSNPSLGFYGNGNFRVLPDETLSFTLAHKLVLIAFAVATAINVYGTSQLHWYLSEMSGVFLILIVVVAIITRMSPDKMIKEFLRGCSGILGGVMIVGLAKAIVVVLTNSHIIDTLLNAAANVLSTVPQEVSAGGMFIVQALIHFLVPSGSGQAMLTMPIMVPLADLLGVTRQTACLVFSLADGIGNTLFPTSGYFMAILAVVGIPWQKWVKVFMPLIALQYAVSFIAAIIANAMSYGPF